MPKMDEMPDSWASKFHEDRRQHGEVSAVTIVNSDTYRRNHARIAWGIHRPVPDPIEKLDALLNPQAEQIHESQRFQANFDRIFGKND